jgi:hypothetical protein
MAVQTEYAIDLLNGFVINATSVSSSFVTPPVSGGLSPSYNLGLPNQGGNYFWLSVDGATIGMSATNIAYANCIMKIAPGTYLSRPVWLAPNKTIFVITASAAATLNFSHAIKVG